MLHCWTSGNCNIILQYLEYAYQNQFTWYELLILHVSWFCWKCVKFHRIFLSCYVIDRVISVYLYIEYNILLNFLKSIAGLSWIYFNGKFYKYVLPKEKGYECKYDTSRSSTRYSHYIPLKNLFCNKNEDCEWGAEKNANMIEPIIQIKLCIRLWKNVLAERVPIGTIFLLDVVKYLIDSNSHNPLAY